MKDEIKEILDKPKILMLSYGNYISLDDYVKLKDYITNLQEERERLIRAWETALDDFEKEYAKNERAKEVYIKELIEANNRGEDMPLVAVEMYNILEGNKK